MATLAEMLDRLGYPIEQASNKELRWACELIIRTQAIRGDELDTLRCAFEKGPLWDGDVPSKSARDQLVDDGLMEKVVVKGEDGFNACTYRGAWAYRLIRVGAMQAAREDDHA